MNDHQRQQEEEARLRRLRLVIDSTCYRLCHGVASPDDAIDLIVETKARVLELFPDKGAQFDLIYLPRLLRLVHARWKTTARHADQPVGALLEIHETH
jgi:hypothetical protein